MPGARDREAARESCKREASPETVVWTMLEGQENWEAVARLARCVVQKGERAALGAGQCCPT